MIRALDSVRYLAALLLVTVGLGMLEVVLVHGGFDTKSKHLNDPETMEQIAATLGTIYPQRSLSHYVKGALSVRAKQHEPALNHFERAISYRGTEENLLYDYAVNLVACRRSDDEVASAVDAWRFHFPGSGRPDPRTARENKPATLDSAHYEAAITALRSGDYVTARKRFEQDIRAGSHSEQLFYNYAVTLVLQSAAEGDVARAIGHWRENFPFSPRPDPRTILDQLSRQHSTDTRELGSSVK